MSWVTGLVGKAEDLLNKIDQSAGDAFKKEEEARAASRAAAHAADTLYGEKERKGLYAGQSSWGVSEKPMPRSERIDRTEKREHHLSPKKTTTGSSSSLSSSASVPSNLNKLNNQESPDAYTSQRSNSFFSGSKSAGPSRQNSRAPNHKDKDAELFEFLNSAEAREASKKKVPEKTLNVTNALPVAINGKPQRSRNNSGSSSVSDKSNKTRENSAATTPTDRQVIFANEDIDSLDQSSNENHDDLLGNNDSSSGYHSNQEEGSSQQLSSLELENKLLKNEVASLNQEMASVMQRAKEAQNELDRKKRKGDAHNHQITQMEQIVRELRSREGDFNEALSAKDSQLAVLRVRYEELNKQLEGKDNIIHKITDDKDRILKDHSDSSGIHSQALLSLKEKLTETEAALRREQQAYKAVQQEAMERQTRLGIDQQGMAESLNTLQRKITEEKARVHELNHQLKSAKIQSDHARLELTEYKDKAARILQSKDKLIASLKEGSSVTIADMGVSTVEYDMLKQERDILKEEQQQNRMALENLRTEIQDLEAQMQSDSDAAQEQISALEDNAFSERRHREEAEHENAKHKQELRYAHEEMLRQKTSFQQRMQEKEMETDRYKNQLATRNLTSNNQVELENRLHALTESLIQKQTMLEALGTEKNSLVLQLERLETQYRDVQRSVVKANASAIVMQDDEEEVVRQRLPTFMRELPQDGDVTRSVKRAANSIDKFSIRLGVFLRRYPMARVFVIVYMFLLHFWVMIVLLTYQPEIHGLDRHSMQPEPPLDKTD